MATYSLIIYNARVVSPSHVSAPDTWIGVRDGAIHTVQAGAPPLGQAARCIDAEGGYVTPGGIDTHVHLEQLQVAPEDDTGDSFYTGTRSAVAGGTTTIVAFANQQRHDESLFPLVNEYHRRASSRGTFCDYGFHMILTKPTPKILDEELPQLASDEGITSIKVYMTYEARRLGDRDMLEIMLRTRRLGMTLMVHAENDDMVQIVIDHLRENRLTEPIHHVLARTPLAEAEATNRAICLSTLVATPILIVHVSSAEAMARIRLAQSDGFPIFAETCPQYLLMLADAYMPAGGHGHGGGGCGCSSVPLVPDNFSTNDTSTPEARYESAKMVCSPPLREAKSDLDAVWKGLFNGTVTTISSDHCPSKFSHPKGKQKGKVGCEIDFTKIPNGLPGVETRLPLLMSYGVDKRKISVQRFVQVCCSQPAHLYGLQHRKGEIAPGMDADIVVWYPKPINDVVTNEALHHDVDYTPFEGVHVTNWPRYTVLRGEVMWDRDGAGVAKEPRGQFVKRVQGTMGWEDREETHLERISRLGSAQVVSLSGV